MVPDTVNGVVTLLLLVLPGLHYDLIRKQRQPDQNDSAFVEISRILLAGVLLSGVTLGVIGLAHEVGSTRLVDYNEILLDRTYIAKHIPVTAGSITWFLLIALTLGSCVASLWPYKVAITSNDGSAWLIAFSDIPQKAARRLNATKPDVIVQVKMKNGLQYRGLLQYYSKDAAIADREIILMPPITVDRGSATGDAASDWHRLILPGSEVAELFVHYREAGTTLPASTSTLRKILAIAPAISSLLYSKIENSAWLAGLLGIEILLIFIYAAV